MWRYLQMHEKLIRDLLAADKADTPWDKVLGFHLEQLARMQHERLIHLIVTMFIALFLLLSLAFSLSRPSWSAIGLSFLFLLLTIGYLQHYFRLENGVQRWYFLGHKLAAKAGQLSADYSGKEPLLLLPAKD